MKKRTLVLPTLAVLSLIGCTKNEEEVSSNSKVQPVYSSAEECKKDWNSEGDCRIDPQTHTVFGPWMYYYLYQQGFVAGHYRGSSGVNSAETGSFHAMSSVSHGEGVSISRGGFGSTGHGSGGAGE